MRAFFLFLFSVSFLGTITAQDCGYTITDSTLSISCNGMCDGYAGISVSGGGSPYTYSWSNGSTTNESLNLCGGTYTVLITDTSGCDSLFAFPEVKDPAPLRTGIVKTDLICDILGSVKLNSSGGYKPYKYLFTGYEDTLDMPVFNDLDLGLYTLTMVDRLGCTADTTFEIVEVECTEPTPAAAFSPNGDGINEKWSIVNMQNFPNCRITVYDRWGQRVYWSNGYNEPWDGQGVFGTLPAASYYYIIELDRTNKNSQIVKGSVAIVR